MWGRGGGAARKGEETGEERKRRDTHVVIKYPPTVLLVVYIPLSLPFLLFGSWLEEEESETNQEAGGGAVGQTGCPGMAPSKSMLL